MYQRHLLAALLFTPNMKYNMCVNLQKSQIYMLQRSVVEDRGGFRLDNRQGGKCLRGTGLFCAGNPLTNLAKLF